MFESVFCTIMIKNSSFGGISELRRPLQGTVGICFPKPHILILTMVCLKERLGNGCNLAKGSNFVAVAAD